jgi:HxlR-like helix-turn-helix protein
VLPGISTEQLRSRLNRMVADGMLTRKRYREVPPRVDYELTERARELVPVLGALARWGYDWAWSEPRPGEAVDVGAIFRLAPGMLEPSGPERTAELVISDREVAYVITVSAERVAVAERRAPDADAHVSGPVAAWVAAFSPVQDRSGLELTGDAELASQVLDGLAADGHGSANSSRDAAVA